MRKEKLENRSDERKNRSIEIKKPGTLDVAPAKIKY
jgi:hypothetical protein